MYRKFTEDEQAMWLLQLEVLNYPGNEHAPYQIAKQRNAPSARTLRRWWKVKNSPSIDKLVRQQKKNLVERIDETIDLLLDHIAIDVESNGVDAVRGATAFGILVDKKQLLSGEPTDIKEVNVTDHRKRIMADLARKSGGYVIGEPPGNGAKPIG